MRRILSVLTLTVLAASCSKVAPGSFWTDFRSELITTEACDAGPWGGHRAIHWKSEKEGTFNSKELTDFAAENGWEYAASASYTEGALRLPLTTYIDDRDSLYILKEKVLGQLTSRDNDIFIFKTRVVTYSPVDTHTQNNGFVTIGANGKELSVFHMWGE
jgi:hypothetical protein